MEKQKSDQGSNASPNRDEQGDFTTEAVNAAVFEDLDVENCTEKDLDERVKKAVSLLDKNQTEEAIAILEETLQIAENRFKSNEVLVARYHYELGSAILQKIENSKEVFGDAIKISEKEGQEETGAAETQPNAQVNPAQPQSSTPKSQVITINTAVPGAQATSKDLVTIADETNGQEEGDELEDKAEEQKNENQPQPQAEEPQNEISMNKEPEAKEEDQVDDFQVSWEHLEVARVSLEKLISALDPTDPTVSSEKMEENTKLMRLLSSVMLRLGDLNCCDDKFDQALEDYGKSLKLRKFTEDPYFSRELAEIFYLIGNAKLYKNTAEQDEEALIEFNKARLILENLLYKLMDSSSFKDPEDLKNQEIYMSREFLKPNMFETAKIKEVKDIINELYNKIEDTKEQYKDRAKVDTEIAKAKMNAQQQESSENTFGKPMLSTTTNPDEKPRIVNLGKLGNAKRNHQQMENGGSNVSTQSTERKVTFNFTPSNLSNQGGSSNMFSSTPMTGFFQGLNKQAENQTSSNNGTDNFRSEMFSGIIKKADENGHVEKMVKKSSEE